MKNYFSRTGAKPTSTPSTRPVTQEFAGSSSHAIADATSSGSPNRPSACIASGAAHAASLPVIPAASGVAVSPGATQFTRIPGGA